jgi:homoserine O-succinyltransferase/O-acetyltransferase
MPLIIDGGRIPAAWAEREGWRAGRSADSPDSQAECIKIALINNMPDAALEDTELQFFDLLNAAAEDRLLLVKLFSLPKIPRSDRGQEHLNGFYFGIEDLLSSQFDGVIITGTEPRHSDLRQEPYWPVLADVLDWAEENTASTVLSCLAAHAGVLHNDGIGRHALDDKQFGIFDDRRVSDHVLTSGTSEPMRFPHSRWNEVREDALTSSGYSVLTKSAEAGVNLFVKKKKKSLFVHFQGHPEYVAGTLWKEYRRDIKRFLRRERPTYPKMPHGYFEGAVKRALDEFRETALSHPSEERLAEFPEVDMGDGLESVWHSAAARVYGNWLQYVVARRARTAVYAPSAPSRISVTWSR